MVEKRRPVCSLFRWKRVFNKRVKNRGGGEGGCKQTGNSTKRGKRRIISKAWLFHRCHRKKWRKKKEKVETTKIAFNLSSNFLSVFPFKKIFSCENLLLPNPFDFYFFEFSSSSSRIFFKLFFDLNFNTKFIPIFMIWIWGSLPSSILLNPRSS